MTLDVLMVVNVEFRAFRDRADGQCPELSDGHFVDFRERLKMDLELITEKGSLARALCEGLPPLLHRDHQLLELVDGLRERVVRHCLNVHKTFLQHLSSSSAPSSNGSEHEDLQPLRAEK